MGLETRRSSYSSRCSSGRWLTDRVDPMTGWQRAAVYLGRVIVEAARFLLENECKIKMTHPGGQKIDSLIIGMRRSYYLASNLTSHCQADTDVSPRIQSHPGGQA